MKVKEPGRQSPVFVESSGGNGERREAARRERESRKSPAWPPWGGIGHLEGELNRRCLCFALCEEFCLKRRYMKCGGLAVSMVTLAFFSRVPNPESSSFREASVVVGLLLSS